MRDLPRLLSSGGENTSPQSQTEEDPSPSNIQHDPTWMYSFLGLYFVVVGMLQRIVVWFLLLFVSGASRIRIPLSDRMTIVFDTERVEKILASQGPFEENSPDQAACQVRVPLFEAFRAISDQDSN